MAAAQTTRSRPAGDASSSSWDPSWRYFWSSISSAQRGPQGAAVGAAGEPSCPGSGLDPARAGGQTSSMLQRGSAQRAQRAVSLQLWISTGFETRGICPVYRHTPLRTSSGFVRAKELGSSKLRKLSHTSARSRADAQKQHTDVSLSSSLSFPAPLSLYHAIPPHPQFTIDPLFKQPCMEEAVWDLRTSVKPLLSPFAPLSARAMSSETSMDQKLFSRREHTLEAQNASGGCSEEPWPVCLSVSAI